MQECLQGTISERSGVTASITEGFPSDRHSILCEVNHLSFFFF